MFENPGKLEHYFVELVADSFSDQFQYLSFGSCLPKCCQLLIDLTSVAMCYEHFELFASLRSSLELQPKLAGYLRDSLELKMFTQSSFSKECQSTSIYSKVIAECTMVTSSCCFPQSKCSSNRHSSTRYLTPMRSYS